MIKLNSQLNRFFLYNIVIVFFSIFTSCEKEPDQLGLGVLPGSENFVVQTDTTRDLLATTVKLDSIVGFYPDTSLVIFRKMILGHYSDPFLGITKASMLFNFFPDSIDHSFGTNPKVDSLILYLGYDSVMGDKNGEFQVNIYELSKSIPYSEKYYTEIDDNSYKGRLLLVDTIQFADTLLRMKINDTEYIKKLFNTPSFEKADLKNFHNYITGLYVEVNQLSSTGAMAQIYSYYTSAFPTRMLIKYHNAEKDTTRSFNYLLRRGSTKINKISHDYTGTGIESALQNSEFSQKVTYVQGMGGLGTRVQIPNISKWADEAPISINKAELIIPVDTAKFSFPQRLSIMSVSGSGKRSVIEYGFGQTFIGGVYESDKKQYTFNLAKHIQKIANSKILGTPVDTEFVIVADGYKIGQPYSFSSVALDFSPGKGAKLNVIYSKQ